MTTAAPAVTDTAGQVIAGACAITMTLAIIKPVVTGTSAEPGRFFDPARRRRRHFQTAAFLLERRIVPAVLERLSDLDNPDDLTRWPGPRE
jgi:hypothetical protein